MSSCSVMVTRPRSRRAVGGACWVSTVTATAGLLVSVFTFLECSGVPKTISSPVQWNQIGSTRGVPSTEVYASLANVSDRSSCWARIARTYDIAGEPWSPLILRDVWVGISRFDDIQRDLGISRKVLTERLKWLVAQGVLEQRAYSERPVRYDYVLTGKGRELVDVLMAITAWADCCTPATWTSSPVRGGWRRNPLDGRTVGAYGAGMTYWHAVTPPPGS